ncbi:XRE family transcriptional regulator [Herbiconiux sp. 11R-BC]|uniref:helix-turn-helix domain-containing protein n=1 Tax=Herbiconiux sp. 11R-BC TaxID=3111637 RepID=UPI003C04F611
MNETAAERIGARLRAARTARGATLVELAAATGISASTLSRLESGKRQPNLELLIPVTATLEITIDELVSDAVPDPRVRRASSRPSPGRPGVVVQHLSKDTSPMQTVRMTLPGREPSGAGSGAGSDSASGSAEEPVLRTHDGFEWVYVLEGRLRLMLGEHDIVMKPGEAAEFATRVPHWLGSADGDPVELMCIFSRDGERIHVRAQTEPDRRAGR